MATIMVPWQPKRLILGFREGHAIHIAPLSVTLVGNMIFEYSFQSCDSVSIPLTRPLERIKHLVLCYNDMSCSVETAFNLLDIISDSACLRMLWLDELQVKMNQSTEQFRNGDKDDKQIIGKTYIILLTFFVLIGVISNILSFLLMCRKTFRRMSISVYLMTLAIVDNALLISGPLIHTIFRSKHGLDMDLLTRNIHLCKILRFSVYFFAQMSAACIVLVSIERLFVIMLPHR